MKRKPNRKSQPEPATACPDWLRPEAVEDTPEESLIPFPEANELVIPGPKFSAEEIKYLAANMEKGIRDLPVWKDLVKRVGIKEARKILRQSVFINRITDSNPHN